MWFGFCNFPNIMNRVFYFILLLPFLGYGQGKVSTDFIVGQYIKMEQLIAIDNYGAIYFILNNTFYKKSDQTLLNYSNLQLGAINNADAFNPLKINIHYKPFNTVMVLDKKLTELYKIDFNTLLPYKNASHIATGPDTTLWIFNQDLQQLELYDYKNNKTRAMAMPVQANVLDLTSNYNQSYLLTEDFLYIYNYTGSTISKIKNEGFFKIAQDNGNLIIQTSKGLLYLDKKSSQPIPIELPQLLIKQFSLTNQSLYIYADETLHQFQLKIN